MVWGALAKLEVPKVDTKFWQTAEVEVAVELEQAEIVESYLSKRLREEQAAPLEG